MGSSREGSWVERATKPPNPETGERTGKNGLQRDKEREAERIISREREREGEMFW